MRRLRSVLAVLALTLVLPCVQASARDMVNLLENGDFESGMPTPWRAYLSGDYTVVNNPKEAHAGTYYATFAWRPHQLHGYSSLCNFNPKTESGTVVYEDVQYELTVYAKGRGSFNLWICIYTPSDRSLGTDFGETYQLTDTWKRYTRFWKPRPGVGRIRVFLRVHDKGVACFDDIFFGYDRDRFTPPEAETLTVAPKVEPADAACTLFLNGKPFDAPAKITYGEGAVAVEARATGQHPRLKGSVAFGDYAVPLDGRWRAAPLPDGDAWKQSGFDDRQWQPVEADAGGVWAAGGGERIALRRVLLWKSSRKEPWRENYWLPMMRDEMYVAEGSAGAFTFIVPNTTQVPASQMTMHIEAPAFLTLLDRTEGAGHWLSNLMHSELSSEKVTRDGVAYVQHAITFKLPTETRWPAHAALYFQADEGIERRDDYRFTFWREMNGNVTDVPIALPLHVTGPINGRRCDYFDLTYSKPPVTVTTSNSHSYAERDALRRDLLKMGVGVIWAAYLDKTRGILDSYLAYRDAGAKLVWGIDFGLNYPHVSSQPIKLLDEHPEFRARFYEGAPKLFEDGLGYHHRDMTGRDMWCQEYLAGGGKVFYDSLRPAIQEAKEKLGEIFYVFWDWEYPIAAYSCFCDRCVSAFRRFAKIPEGERLTDETIVTKYAGQWKAFRYEQSARHMTSMNEFCKEYGTRVNNWSPTPSITYGDFDYSLVKDWYRYHFFAWPGATLPLQGAGRDGWPASLWQQDFPGIHLVGQTIVDYFAGMVVDERMFKIWTVNVALGTAGGGWVLWLDSTYPLNQTSGMSYFIGEATRLIHDFEGFFTAARLITPRFKQEGLKGAFSSLVALESADGKEALVLLFNQEDEPAEVTVTPQGQAPWTAAQQWEGRAFEDTGKVTVTVPAKDVIALRYK